MQQLHEMAFGLFTQGNLIHPQKKNSRMDNKGLKEFMIDAWVP